MKLWYDGYRIGDFDIYCPWDVLNYVKDLRRNADAMPKSYWKDTSHNDIIRKNSLRMICRMSVRLHSGFPMQK